MTESAAAETVEQARQRLLNRRLRGGAGSLRTPPARGPRPERLPLTSAQERLWLHQELHPTSAAYNIAEAVQIDGDFDPALLGAAAAEISRRHEALRMTFHAADGRPFAVVHDRLDPTVELVTSDFDVTAATRVPFDLERGPLIRLMVSSLAAEQHVVLVVVHHIVADGWSVSLIIGELTSAYLRCAGGSEPDWAAPSSFADIMVERGAVSPRRPAELAYWRDQLALADPTVPALSEEADAQLSDGATVRIELPAELGAALRAACRASGVTPYMALLSAYGCLLRKYGASDRLVIGTPVAGRDRPEWESAVGYFANTLPLVLDMSGEPTVAELWQRAKNAVIGALSHSSVALGEIAAAMRDDGMPDQAGFGALFALQNYPFNPVRVDAVTVTPIELPKSEAKVDVSLYLYERDGAYAGYLEHRRKRIGPDGAARLAADFRQVVAAMAVDSAAPMSSVSALDGGSRTELLALGSGPGRQRPEVAVHQLFEASADRAPAATAVIDLDGRALTFQQIECRANHLAARLIAGGLRPEQRVGLRMSRSADLVVAMLGVLKAGGAFVPLDPAYPAARIQAMTDDARAARVLTHSDLADLPGTAIGRPSVRCWPEQLAYVVYTSGSTGSPKGIGVTHASVVNHNLSTAEMFGLTAADRVLSFASPSFDATIEEIFPALAVGAAVVPRPDDVIDTFHRFDEFLAARAVTVACLPTAFWERWSGHLRDAAPGAACLPPSVRAVTLSGQRLVLGDAQGWLADQRTAAVTLVNTYGPTEATVTTTTHALGGPAGLELGPGQVPIGTPWPGYRVYVLDASGQLVPPGVTGELCIGGAGVTRGYLGRPALTAGAFRPDPFSAEPGARLYRAGDLARWRPDGTLEFVGRIDSQVKVRGNRVEPGEVEAVLSASPGVRQCAVVAYSDGAHGHVLGAHVVAERGVTNESLLEDLRARLPGYMVPAHIQRHDALPTTPNGKTDRAALPAPPLGDETEFVAPAGEMEQAIAIIWRDILHVEHVGRHSDLFHLGGESLLATVLLSRIEQDLGRRLTLAQVFSHPTLAELAAVAEAAPKAAAAARIPAAPSLESVTDDPLAPAQRRIYLLDVAGGAGTSYNMPLALDVRGEADPSRVRDALARLIDRHESLRACFGLRDGEPRQRILPRVSFEMPVIDVRVGQVASTLASLVTAFDLGCAPLLRAHWLRVAPDHAVLFIDVHHIVADGTALAVLVEEFVSLLAGAELGPVEMSYRDVVYWQAAPDVDGRAESARRYWSDRLSGYHPPDYPWDHPRPDRQTFAGFTRTFQVGASVVNQLKAVAKEHHATVNHVLLATHCSVLASYCDQPELVVGSIVADRRHPALTHVVGMFANFLPLRIAVRAEDTFATLLARTRDAVVADYDHADLPFEEIVEVSGQPAPASRSALFDTMVIVHDQPGWDSRPDLGSLEFQPVDVVHGTAKLDLKLDAFPERDGTITISVEANAALIDPARVDDFIAHFQALLGAGVMAPDKELSAIQWRDPAEAAAADRRRRRQRDGDVVLAIAASFTAEPVAESLRWWTTSFGMDVRIRFAGFGQVVRELIDPGSLLRGNTGANLLLVQFADWLADIPDGPAQVTALYQMYAELISALAAAEHSAAKWYAGILPSVVGSEPEPIAAALSDLSERWRADLAEMTWVSVLDLDAARQRHAVAQWFDPVTAAVGRVPFTADYFAVIGTEVARQLIAWRRQPFKVIAVDADGTLWRGTVGEDGVGSLQIDAAAAAVQRLLLRKRSEGMLLALVSKNAEEDVWAAFDQVPGMSLRRDHFAAARVNWQPKSANLREIAAELSLGLDSFVFIDDSDVECIEVGTGEPDVLAIRLPHDRADHEAFLDHLWVLDADQVTDDDRARADRYAEQRARDSQVSAAASLDEFLRGLELAASVTPAETGDYDRISQLTVRTNQFNLSGVRLSPGEVAAIAADPCRAVSVVHVRDRYGDYGLAGAVFTTIHDNNVHLDNMLLSCRVLGRNIDEALLVAIARDAAGRGAANLTATFTQTNRNQRARSFLERFGWASVNGEPQVWHVPTGSIPSEPSAVSLSLGERLARPGEGQHAGAPVQPPSAQRELATLDHVGIAVADLAAATAHWTSLGYTASESVTDPLQQSAIAMLELAGCVRVELVAPISDRSPTATLLSRGGNRPYHLCFQVESIGATLTRWDAAGIDAEPLGDAVPAVLFGGRLVRFVQVAGIGLIELLETGGPAPARETAVPARRPTRGAVCVAVADPAEALRFMCELGYAAVSAGVVSARPGEAALIMLDPASSPEAARRVDEFGAGPLELLRHYDKAGGLVTSVDRSGWAQPAPSGTIVRHAAYHLPLCYGTAPGLRPIPSAAPSAAGHRRAYVAPRDDHERIVVAAYLKVLHQTQVGVHDSFFALGGHSLRAVSLIAELYRVTGVTLELHEVFQTPTPAALAAVLATRTAADTAVAQPPAPTIGTDGVRTYPASAAQSRMLLGQATDQESLQYNLPHAFGIPGRMDMQRLQLAFSALVARHEILRTKFQVGPDDTFVQIVLAADEVVADIDIADADGSADDAIRGFVRPFDPQTPPLMRIGVRIGSDGERRLLLADIHHAIADGASLAILVTDFLALYHGERLPPVAYHYGSFAQLENDERDSGARQAERDYWLSQFDGDVPVLDLPPDFPRPPVRTTDGGAVWASLDRGLVDGLSRVSDSYGATLYVTMLTALYAVLWRHTRQRDLVIGTPVAGRLHPEAQAVPGPFLNTLALRACVEPAESFGTMLSRVRDMVILAMRHQGLAFDALVDMKNVERDASRHPLFDVMFAYQNFDFSAEADGVEQIRVSGAQAQFDLELFAHADDDGVELRLVYATRLFRQDTAERLLAHFEAVLRAVVADPEQALSRIDLLGGAERAALMAGLNRRDLDLPAGETVVGRILAKAEVAAESAALRHDGTVRSYGDLDRESARMAAILRAAGVRRNDHVAVLLERGTAMAEVILGAWRIGAAYVPLEPHYPGSRITSVLTDAACPVLVTRGAHIRGKALEVAGCAVIDLTELADVVPEEREERVDDLAMPGDVAYTIFTSGSTGRPKGASVAHLGMLNHMLAKIADLALASDAVIAQTASACFDISVWQFFCSLLIGGQTVIYGDEVVIDPRALLTAIRADRVTVLQLVPAAIEALLDLLEASPAALPHLRVLVATGDALPPSLASRWLLAYPRIPIVNAYGPTEASDDITHHLIDSVAERVTIPLGRPIPNARIYLVDDTIPLDTPGGGALVPVGTKGEICVAGPCVGLGYLNDPVRTAAVFCPDPFGPEPGGLLYRTGDIGRWLPDGTLEFFGRMDHQVKIRGHRIELGEVEAALASCHLVAASAAIVHGSALAERRLIGYVIPAGQDSGTDGAALADAIRAHIALALPRYMMPAAIVVLSEFPLTANGKLDRNALAAMPAAFGSAAEPLSGPTEIAVAEVLATVLGIDPPGANGDFFELGGHSLKVIGLLAQLRQKCGVELPLADVFAGPTVRELAQSVDRVRSIGHAVGAQTMMRLGPAQEDRPLLFMFPPIAGWGLVYLPLAGALAEYTVYAFDFVEEEHRIGRYADLIQAQQPGGPLLLGGYSAGGNLAYEVARELELRGRTIAQLVLFDTSYRGDIIDEPQDQVRARVRAEMTEGLAQLGPELEAALSDGVLRERAVVKRERFVHYLNALTHRGLISADVTLITADDSMLDADAQARWRAATAGPLVVRSGSGDHSQMMAGPHARQNADLLRQVITTAMGARRAR